MHRGVRLFLAWRENDQYPMVQFWSGDRGSSALLRFQFRELEFWKGLRAWQLAGFFRSRWQRLLQLLWKKGIGTVFADGNALLHLCDDVLPFDPTVSLRGKGRDRPSSPLHSSHLEIGSASCRER